MSFTSLSTNLQQSNSNSSANVNDLAVIFTIMPLSAAERMRHYRWRKRTEGIPIIPKRPPKSVAQRVREHRERKRRLKANAYENCSISLISENTGHINTTATFNGLSIRNDSTQDLNEISFTGEIKVEPLDIIDEDVEENLSYSEELRGADDLSNEEESAEDPLFLEHSPEKATNKKHNDEVGSNIDVNKCFTMPTITPPQKPPNSNDDELNKNYIDEDKAFLLSLLPAMKELNGQQKMEFKMIILEQLRRLRYPTAEQTNKVGNITVLPIQNFQNLSNLGLIPIQQPPPLVATNLPGTVTSISSGPAGLMVARPVQDTKIQNSQRSPNVTEPPSKKHKKNLESSHLQVNTSLANRPAAIQAVLNFSRLMTPPTTTTQQPVIQPNTVMSLGVLESLQQKAAHHKSLMQANAAVEMVHGLPQHAIVSHSTLPPRLLALKNHGQTPTAATTVVYTLPTSTATSTILTPSTESNPNPNYRVYTRKTKKCEKQSETISSDHETRTKIKERLSSILQNDLSSTSESVDSGSEHSSDNVKSASGELETEIDVEEIKMECIKTEPDEFYDEET